MKTSNPTVLRLFAWFWHPRLEQLQSTSRPYVVLEVTRWNSCLVDQVVYGRQRTEFIGTPWPRVDRWLRRLRVIE